ncbi:hypothetical protein JCM9140_2388 [Halalkalibacter wakoensis JCM 9140]|uniref:Uncharacterized protein n=1 Tax=Halalkalibacter wakoensis JCM 9140 TaxID=1236970 RepID=W4Q2X0_9BACI|nr:hypothetical protein [Halalkalibacter wakoensis]GAE26337.1 hypothetical protein JCM9140_2388 [Halalkalibacter wakoensis JCM 9140]
MFYQRERMRKLLSYDRFLLTAFDEAMNVTGDEEAALHAIFTSYVKNDPMFTNAYNLLTTSDKS